MGLFGKKEEQSAKKPVLSMVMVQKDGVNLPIQSFPPEEQAEYMSKFAAKIAGMPVERRAALLSSFEGPAAALPPALRADVEKAFAEARAAPAPPAGEAGAASTEAPIKTRTSVIGPGRPGFSNDGALRDMLAPLKEVQDALPKPTQKLLGELLRGGPHPRTGLRWGPEARAEAERERIEARRGAVHEVASCLAAKEPAERERLLHILDGFGVSMPGPFGAALRDVAAEVRSMAPGAAPTSKVARAVGGSAGEGAPPGDALR